MDPGDCKLIQLFAHIIFTSVRAFSIEQEIYMQNTHKIVSLFPLFLLLLLPLCSLPFLLCAHYLWTRSGYKIIEVAAAHFKVINSLEGSLSLSLSRSPFGEGSLSVTCWVHGIFRSTLVGYVCTTWALWNARNAMAQMCKTCSQSDN